MELVLSNSLTLVAKFDLWTWRFCDSCKADQLKIFLLYVCTFFFQKVYLWLFIKLLTRHCKFLENAPLFLFSCLSVCHFQMT